MNFDFTWGFFLPVFFSGLFKSMWPMRSNHHILHRLIIDEKNLDILTEKYGDTIVPLLQSQKWLISEVTSLVGQLAMVFYYLNASESGLIIEVAFGWSDLIQLVYFAIFIYLFIVCYKIVSIFSTFSSPLTT